MKDKGKKREYDKKRYEEKKILILERNKTYYNNNKETIKISHSLYSKEYYILNKEKLLQQHSKWEEENKEQRKEYLKKYREGYKDKRNNDIKHRVKNDPLFKLTISVRSLINDSFKRKHYLKNDKTEEILGCDFNTFKIYIESKFEPWMNWENKGNPKDGIFELNKTWDIDHVIPISSALTEEDIIKLNHYTNLKPLCSYYNRWIKR